jgi:hypothetical protein
MPLLDHFRSPLSRQHSWRSFHGMWAAAMARLLNAGVLPPGYIAAPFVDRDGPIDIDVATLQGSESTETPEGAQGTQPWNPGEPAITVAVPWPPVDDVRVEVLTDGGDLRLAAAIELVSPRNKDRAKAREAFAAKCAENLRRGCGVVVVDVVTTRHADMHAEIMAMLEAEGAGPGELAAVSYRSIGGEEDGQLQVWPFALALGQALPMLSLWLNGEIAIPLDLEASYTAACVDLRIRQGTLRAYSGNE